MRNSRPSKVKRSGEFSWLNSTAGSDDIVGLVAVLCLLAVALYFLPSIIAFRRRHPNRYAILVVNLLFGGTGIGWLGCLVWSLNAVHLPVDPGRSPGGESGLNLFANDPKIFHLTSVPSATASTLSGAARLSTADAIAEFDRLGRLYAAGHLSDADLATLKSSVLNRMR